MREKYWNVENKMITIFRYMIVSVKNPREVMEKLLEQVKEYAEVASTK